MQFQKLSNLDEYMVPETNLDRYLDRVREGNPVVYRTPFYKDRDQEQVLSNWQKRLNKLSGVFTSLLDFENDLLKKVGPTSVMQPLDKRMPDVESYYASIEREANPLDPGAIRASLLEWESVKGDSISRLQHSDTVKQMKLSTNSGTPYFTRRSTILNDTLPFSITLRDGDYWQDLPNVSKKLAAIIGWRGQEGGPSEEDVKQRVVWMFPFALNVAELSMYQPLLKSFQRHRLVPAWISNDLVDEWITNMFDTKDPDELVICTDFSKFDQHFNPTLAACAKELIASLVRDSAHNAHWLEVVFPIKYQIPMILREDLVAVGKHGMGSGSGGTNFDETLVHRTLQHEAARLDGATLNPYSQCLGDDGVLTYPGITVDGVVRHYTRHGLEMNPDKQYSATDHCIYLRRWHHTDYRPDGICRGVYSTYRALGRLMYQERYYDPDKWGPKMVALRQLSILENVKYHPLCDEFAEFCMRGDKYRLGIDIPGFLANIEREAKKATDEMDDFLGYNRSQMDKNPISNWWIVKFLKSKA